MNGNTLTVTRGVDFTSVDSHDAGARVSTWFYTDAEPLFLAEINTWNKMQKRTSSSSDHTKIAPS